MVAGDFAPRFTAALIAKDLRCAVAEAAENTTRVPVLQAARDIFDELCAKGFGGENISAAIKAYCGRPPNSETRSAAMTICTIG
jgi:3-hydroxyisobutyrate dehydrogenase-like beta-hydroxyacid dehydrogenase